MSWVVQLCVKVLVERQGCKRLRAWHERHDKGFRSVRLEAIHMYRLSTWPAEKRQVTSPWRHIHLKLAITLVQFPI
jgi:hypothetical protein